MDTAVTYETLLIERRGAVTLVTINRPQALNALNSQVLADLIDAFGKYDADESQRCAVLTGSEKAFAAGADIKEMADKPAAEKTDKPSEGGEQRRSSRRRRRRGTGSGDSGGDAPQA